MQKQLTELTNEELISIVQDYQEMISEIEEVINDNLGNDGLLKVRDILMGKDMVEYTLVDSELKIQENVNCNPDHKYINEMFEGLNIKYVDVHRSDRDFSSWCNNDETIVFVLPETSFTEMLQFTEYVNGCRPNEFSSNIINGKTVVRMWWD